MASHLGMTLRQALDQMTSLECEVWIEWLSREMNRPDRTDHYLMLIASEVTRSYARYPRRVKMDQYRLEFAGPRPARALTPEEERRQTEATKARWIALMGVPVTVVPAAPGLSDPSSSSSTSPS